MKRKILILCLAVLSFLMPLMPKANAASESDEQKVTIYVFRGSTCPHCHEAMDYFKKLIKKEEFKDIVEVRHLEVWDDDENFEIAKQVYTKMGHEEEYKGSVPYIVIGDKEFSGFSSSTESSIEDAIKTTYENKEFVDEIKDIVGEHGEILVSKMNIVLVLTIFLVIAIILGGTIYFARKESDEEEEEVKPVKKEELEKKVEEVKKEEKKETPKKTTKSTSKSKKKSATKKENKSK